MTKQRHRRVKRFTFSLVEILAVAAIVTSVPSSSYQRFMQKTHQTTCLNNLGQVAQLLEMYNLENDEFPKAAFYPKDPEKGADSIKTILGGPKEIWTCPSMPDSVKSKGMTFVYNDALGGKRAPNNPEKKWVLIEMSCVSHETPNPHPSGYNVLFADGHVITTKRLPKKIQEAWRKQ